MLYVNLFHSISSPHVLLGTPPLGRCLPERQWLQEAHLLHIARDLGSQRASRVWCRAQAGPWPGLVPESGRHGIGRNTHLDPEGSGDGWWS